MIERTLVHVAGPAGAGKTTFIEQLLEARFALAIAVRSDRDPALREAQESAPKSHAELRRYQEAGAVAAALYRFAAPGLELFESRVMREYSEAVYIEGDSPVDFVELAVFVAPVPADGRSLLRRVPRDHTRARDAAIEAFRATVEDRERLARLLGTELGNTLGERALDELRRSPGVTLAEKRRTPPPAPTEHWALEDGYAGIERAGLVVVSVRSDADRRQAEAVVSDIARLREDDDVFRDVVRRRGNRVAITTVVANVANPKDAGTKKAVARVRRATQRRPH